MSFFAIAGDMFCCVLLCCVSYFLFDIFILPYHNIILPIFIAWRLSVLINDLLCYVVSSWWNCWVNQSFTKHSKHISNHSNAKLTTFSLSPVFIKAKDDGSGEWWQLDYWSYKSCKAPVKSPPPPTSSFLKACPSCHPTNSVKALKGKYHIPSICWGLPTLSLTTSSSWLPWGRVPMPLISPLMPVPHKLTTL